MKVQPWHSPLVPFTGMRAGRYRYRATEDDPGQLVDFTYLDGDPTVIVADGEDVGEVLDKRDMRGTFERA